MCSPVMTSAAVPPLVCVERKAKPAYEFFRMSRIVLGWVLLFFLLLCAEAAVELAFGAALQKISRVYFEMLLSHHDVGGKPMCFDGANEDRLTPPTNARDHP